jgi:hypothetical protein
MPLGTQTLAARIKRTTPDPGGSRPQDTKPCVIHGEVAAPVGSVPRGGLRGRQGVAGGDGTLAGADERGCGFEPPGRIGGDADGGVAGRGGGVANPIESALSVTRRVTARVKRWRDGEMRRRWCAAAVVRGGPPARREPVPPGQGPSGPADAHQGPGGIDPSTRIRDRERRRMRRAGGTPSLRDDGWDGGGSRRWLAASQPFPPGLPLFDPDATGDDHPTSARPAGDWPRPAGSPPRRHRP